MNIFIADHSEVFRLGLGSLFESMYGDIHITNVDNGNILMDNTDWGQMDLLILHKSRDKDEVVNLIRTLKLLENGPKILVLSDQPDFSEAKYFFSLGVKGYVDRAAPVFGIREAVQEVLLDKIYVEPSLLNNYFYAGAPSQIQFGSVMRRALTDKELEIATYLVKGFKTSEISKLLNKKSTTISTQKANIYQKLKVSNVVELIHYMDGTPKNGILHVKRNTGYL